MGDTTKRHEMMRTDPMYRNAADDHHVLSRVFETVSERFGRFDVVSAEQTMLPEFAHARGGATGVGAVGGNAAGIEQGNHRCFECFWVKVSIARDAGFAMSVGRVIVVAIVHERAFSGCCTAVLQLNKKRSGRHLSVFSIIMAAPTAAVHPSAQSVRAAREYDPASRSGCRTRRTPAGRQDRPSAVRSRQNNE